MTIGLRSSAALRHRVAIALAATLAAGSALALAGCAGRADAAGCDAAAVPSELGCVQFTSTSGTQGGSPVEWLASDPLRVRLVPAGGTPTLVVGTGCNTLNVPVSVSAFGFLPDPEQMLTTTMLCVDETSEHEAWAATVVSRPMAYDLHGSTLTLMSDGTRIEFERTP